MAILVREKSAPPIDCDRGRLTFERGYFYRGLSIPDPPDPLAHFDPDWIPAAMYSQDYTLDETDTRAVALRMACWRFVFRCAGGCPDAVGDMPAHGYSPSDRPSACPDCRGPTEIVEPADG